MVNNLVYCKCEYLIVYVHITCMLRQMDIVILRLLNMKRQELAQRHPEFRRYLTEILDMLLCVLQVDLHALVGIMLGLL